MSKILKLFCILSLSCVLAGCKLSGEICDPNGEVFLALKSNHSLWFERLKEESNGFASGITNGNYRYIVHGDESGISIVTNPEAGPSASIGGISGYIYLIVYEELQNDSRYNYTYMGDNIWCYMKN